ncbi:MAG: hypothetical protein ACERNK_19165, partial [Deltaproteobacteria bacterium]
MSGHFTPFSGFGLRWTRRPRHPLALQPLQLAGTRHVQGAGLPVPPPDHAVLGGRELPLRFLLKGLDLDGLLAHRLRQV